MKTCRYLAWLYTAVVRPPPFSLSLPPRPRPQITPPPGFCVRGDEKPRVRADGAAAERSRARFPEVSSDGKGQRGREELPCQAGMYYNFSGLEETKKCGLLMAVFCLCPNCGSGSFAASTRAGTGSCWIRQ